MGAHRPSEIAARVGMPATGLAYSLSRLQEMDIIEREIPFGESEKSTKKALYKIKDPFFRFWFSVVADKLSLLADSNKSSRMHILKETLPKIWAQAWEDMCRKVVPHLARFFKKLDHPLLIPAKRLWGSGGSEWDIVSQSLKKKDLILGEAKWTEKNVNAKMIESIFHELHSKGVPAVGKKCTSIYYCVFIPEKPKEKMRLPSNYLLFDAKDVIQSFEDNL